MFWRGVVILVVFKGSRIQIWQEIAAKTGFIFLWIFDPIITGDRVETQNIPVKNGVTLELEERINRFQREGDNFQRFMVPQFGFNRQPCQIHARLQ